MKNFIIFVIIVLVFAVIILYASIGGTDIIGGGGNINFVTPAPKNATDTATHPSISSEDGFFYVTIADDTWQRVAIATWAAAPTEGSLLLSDGSSKLLLSDGTSELLLE